MSDGRAPSAAGCPLLASHAEVSQPPNSSLDPMQESLSDRERYRERSSVVRLARISVQGLEP